MKVLREFINYITNKFSIFIIIRKIFRRDKTPFTAYNKEGSQQQEYLMLINELTALVDLAPGEEGVVKVLSVNNDIESRLKDIGLLEGTVVRCIGESPLGDPKAFLIRGAIIALRCDDCKDILVTCTRMSK